MVEYQGKIPTGTYLLELLVKLLAEQENLAIEYEIVNKKELSRRV